MAYQVVGDFSTYLEARRRGEPPLPAHLGWRSHVRKGDLMADKQSTPESSKSEPAKAEASAASKGSLGPAGESSDPAVHDALARLAVARSNRAALDVNPADIQAADDEVSAAEKALADLGYQA